MSMTVKSLHFERDWWRRSPGGVPGGYWVVLVPVGAAAG